MLSTTVPVLHWLVKNEIGYGPRTVPVRSPYGPRYGPHYGPHLELAGKTEISYVFVKEMKYIIIFSFPFVAIFMYLLHGMLAVYLRDPLLKYIGIMG